MKSLPLVSAEQLSSFDESNVRQNPDEQMTNFLSELTSNNPELAKYLVNLTVGVFQDSQLVKDIVMAANTKKLVEIVGQEMMMKSLAITLVVLGALNSQIESNQLKEMYE